MAFKSQGQRKAVMSKLKMHYTKNYARVRLESPALFQKGSFRTIDPGRKGHTKIVIGRPKGKKTTRAQAILIQKSDI